MNPWDPRDGRQHPSSDTEQSHQQYVSREQAAREFEQIQNQHRQEIQKQQQQLDQLRQQIQQQQQENQTLQQSQQRQHPPSFEAAIALMAEGQRNLADNMSRLLTRLETIPTPKREIPHTSSTSRQNPPHLQTSQNTPHERPNYAPSSLSEGAYAKDPARCLIIQKEPKIRDNLKFAGESRLLRQFLLDIYDVLEQYSNEFANDKRKINWIAAHFVSTTNDVSPAQAWFLALLMKNAHMHGVIDPYANLKSLDYILPFYH